ncbi:LppX_LprAFG lipoprotein [Acrocarpospora sp. B8E8]|uniref:LppX_LprAFG lipoprotein n=1 Tax=Acrocarpospora sp. B8E8 TaxID=3153572 RepID=UPI00325CD293
MRRILWTILSGASLLLGAACSSSDLPSGPELLVKSGAAMAAVKTVAFTLTTEGKPAIQVKRAEGSLTRAGDAKGTIQIELIGTLQELEFVLVGEDVYLKGPTGGYQKSMTRAQLAAFYDPGTVIAGVPELLATAQEVTVEGEEGNAYKVGVKLPPEALKKVVPGIDQTAQGTLLIDKASSRLTRIDLPVTGGTITVTLADYDAPVTVTAPPLS